MTRIPERTKGAPIATVWRYAITHVGAAGLRQLTFANQGRNHYDTRKAAEDALTLFAPSLRAKVLGDAADTLRVSEVECYYHGDALRFYIDDEV